MTPWTKLLEALHSSLIDEVNALLPDDKPELGLPQRMGEWKIPDGSISEVVLAIVEFDKAGGAATRGLVALALNPQAAQRLQLDSTEFWKRLLQRAATEFVRRDIRPRIQLHGVIRTNEANAALPAGIPTPGRLVWIPLRLPGSGAICLGLGA
jgi:hypothetical protein